MTSLFRGVIAVAATATLSGCVTTTPEVATAHAPAIKPATNYNAKLNEDLAQLEAGFAELQSKQDILFELMTAMMQEATRPELIGALKESATRMEAATHRLHQAQ